MITVKISGPADNKKKLAVAQLFNRILKRSGFKKIIISKDEHIELNKIGGACKEIIDSKNTPIQLKVVQGIKFHRSPQIFADNVNIGHPVDDQAIFDEL